jgi:hypothetical protein
MLFLGPITLFFYERETQRPSSVAITSSSETEDLGSSQGVCFMLNYLTLQWCNL